jgi:uncharacterized protein DUF4349
MKPKLLLLSVPLLVLLAACGATTTDNGGTGAAPVQRSGPLTVTNGTATGTTNGAAFQAPASAPLKSATNGTAGTQVAPLPGVPPLPSAQHLELTATIGIQVAHDHFNEGLDTILGIISTEHGYLSASHTDSTGSAPRTGTFTFQVPVDQYQDTLNQLRGVGKFTHQDSTSKPHDAEYVDLQARLKSAQMQLTAFNALLAKATSIADIIAIEQQVAQVQQQIEQYQGQLQYLDSLTQYSTITVDLAEKGAVAPAPRPVQPGFADTFGQVLHNLAAMANAFILVVGTLLPFLLLAVAAIVTRRRWMPLFARP